LNACDFGWLLRLLPFLRQELWHDENNERPFDKKNSEGDTPPTAASA
jgi:hypothetical protein